MGKFENIYKWKMSEQKETWLPVREEKKVQRKQGQQNKGQKRQKEDNRKKNKGRKKRKGMWIEHTGYHRAGSWILCSCLYNLK